MKYFLDTNIILEDCSDLTDCYISSKTLEELEAIKTNRNKTDEIQYRARLAVRAIERDNPHVVIVNKSDYEQLDMLGLETTNDNLIIACACRIYTEFKDVVFKFKTNDYLCGLIAEKCFGLIVEKQESKKSDNLYKGYKIVNATDEDLASVYAKDSCDNIFDCLINEYVVVNDSDGNFADVLKWTGENYKSVYNKNFKSRQLGTCKPLDIQQRMAFDSIVENDITVLTGRAGTGKTTIPLAYIMQVLETGKYKKCYVVYSYETLKNQKTLGYVKGDDLTKRLHTSSIGGILSTKLGDMTEVERLIMSGLIEIVPTADLRGIEIADSICYVSEGQNLDPYALKTVVQRCKTGSKLIIEGDVLEQCDTNRGVGLFKMIDVFKDHKCFGCVKLKNNYRSEISELADEL